jgi:hypothetical protein
MAALPVIKRIQRDDLKEAPAWIDRLIYPLNLFMEAVYYALNKNITFEDNILSQRVSFELTAKAAASDNKYVFAVTMKSVPKMVILGKCEEDAAVFTPIGGAVWIDWTYSEGTVRIESISGLSVGNTYKFELLLV